MLVAKFKPGPPNQRSEHCAKEAACYLIALINKGIINYLFSTAILEEVVVDGPRFDGVDQVDYNSAICYSLILKENHFVA